jgi:hypothetical protein
MAELPPFGPGRAPRNPTYDSALPRVAIPLWSCAAGTFYKISGLLGPRYCTGDRTGIRCFCAASCNCTQPSGQFMKLGQPSGYWRCASASTRPWPLQTLGSGRSTGRVAASAGAVPGCSAHTKSTRNLIYVACYEPMCTYE